MQQITEPDYTMSPLISSENNNKESNKMEVAINQAYLGGKISSELSIW